MKYIKLCVNGEEREAYIEPSATLLDVLRYEFQITSVKSSCETSSCGVCTVLVDGKAVKSCSILAMQVKDKKITTVEGLAPAGQLAPIQQAFIDNFAIACGFCTPGMILSAKALLDEYPNATEEEIRHNMLGNLCRCTGYENIVKAIESVRDAGKAE